VSVAALDRHARSWAPAAGAVAETPRACLTAGVVIFVAAHVAVGPLFYEIRQLAVIHAMAVAAVGAWWAISRNQPLEDGAYIAAYITGAEVLWRVSRVSGFVLFSEWAKYLLVGLMVLALVVRGKITLRAQVPAVLYFALLVPSSLLTWTAQPFSVAREDISFNLSGPLTLAVVAVFFGQFRFANIDRRKMLLALIGPVLSIAAATLFLILTRDDIVFGTESNKATSAHYAPNQVSAVFALAGLAGLLTIVDQRTSKPYKGFMFALMVWLLIQSALTYSRGGLYMFVGAAAVGLLCLFKDADTRTRALLVGAVLVWLADSVVIPYMDDLTGGTLLTRFNSADLTGRDVVVLSELEVFAANPLLGVGPGQAMYHRDVTMEHVAAHTEFTRALAEHGLFGIGSLACLIVMAARTLRAPSTAEEKALVLSAWTFSCLFMVTAAMRVVAPAFLIGMSASLFESGHRGPAGELRYFRQRRRAPGSGEVHHPI
jgi:hypothetical protein